MSSSFDRRVLTKATVTDPGDQIVISGVAGRFPNSDNVASFAANLYNKVDMVDDEEKRWKHLDSEIPSRFGKINRLEKFDAFFFSVHRRQANWMDPQCRMLLEHSYEAILDAGVNPKSMRGSRTGVFIGCCFAESEETMFYAVKVKDGLGLTGSSRAMLANRVSFALGLSGPSFMVDTACSSSMFALDCAFSAMRNGECDSALVGGTNLILHPFVSLQFVRLGVVAKDGYCRPFDKNAAGYSRSEGVCVLFLQKAADAKRIYANVVYSKSNNDGFKKEGITFPSGKMQIELLKEFYGDLKMDASEVSFVECHSTGTKVGDPEEIHTLDEIFCKGRKGRPLPVGSVKSNMGHAEATSGVASITKVLLAFENQLIPPNIHYTEPRAGISALEEGRLQVVTEPQKLDGPFICVNSFGFGGANAHALFRAHSKEKVNRGIPNDNLPRLVLWGGRTEEAVISILDSITKQPLDAEYIGLLQNSQIVSASANTYRGFGIYNQIGNSDNAKAMTQNVQHYDGIKRPVVWVYSGMGSQWCEMGLDLMKIPIYASAIEKCHLVLQPRGLNLKDIITSAAPTMFENIVYSFVGIAAIQIGLTDVLKALGLEPDHIIGHSVGELGCAYADGCLTAEEMVLSAYSRGMASIEAKTVFGSMAAVGIGHKQLQAMVPEGVEIACHNSADSSTISGPAKLVASFVEDLKKQNYLAKEVACSNIPYHSGYISEMGPRLLSRLSDIIKNPKRRSSKWISSSVPKVNWDSIEAQYSSAQYHTSNLLSPVLFEEASELLPKDALTIEIAPHGLLQAILKGSLPEAINIPLTKKGNIDNNSNFLLNALGKIFASGVDMDASKLYPAVSFPVSRGTPMVSSLIKWDHSENHFVTRYEDRAAKSTWSFTINISDAEFDYVLGHQIDGRILFPATGYLFLVWQVQAELMRVKLEDCDVEIEDVKFHRATVLQGSQDVELKVVIHKGNGMFEVSEGTNSIVTGTVRALTSKLTELDDQGNEDCVLLDSRDFYKELRLRGYHYKDLFRSVVTARADGQGGKIKWSSNWVAFLDCLLQMNIIAKDTRSLMLPTGLRKLMIKPKDFMAAINAISDGEKVLEIKVCFETSLLRCAGIEMQGMHASLVARRRSPGVPVLETYQFMPYLNGVPLSKVDMARSCVQLFLENIPIANVITIELDNYDEKEPLSDYFDQSLGDLPLVTGELTYLTSRTLDLGKVNVRDCALSTFSNLSFVIKSKAVSDAGFLESTVGQLRDGGIIVSREEPSASNSIFAQTLPQGFQIITVMSTEDELIVLIQYNSETYIIPTKVIKITNEHYEWLNELKESIQSGPVIAYAEKEEFCGIIGLVNCIRKEPNGLNLKCVFINDLRVPPFDIENYFYKSQLQYGFAFNVFKNGRWGSYRHMMLQKESKQSSRTDHCFANALTRGDLSSLTWLKGPFNYSQQKRDLVRVQYASLNFRDVMMASGKLTVEIFGSGRLDQLCVLGLEYSGINEKNNKRVMGMVASGALGTHLKNTEQSIRWDVPDEWTLEEAATVPIVYATVYSAFFMTVQIKEGQSILIHAGSGGVGLAAIRVALAYGLEVYTTVSTEEKKRFLLNEFSQLKAENLGNSRDTSFENMIKLKTKGKGVNYVLNSLAGDKLFASIRCLSRGGKFLEIGKFDLENDTKLGLADFIKGLSFHVVLVDDYFYSKSDEKQEMMRLIAQDIKRGIIKPLKSNVFDAHEIEDAFRYLASGKHTGKIILRMRENASDLATLPISVVPRVYCSPDLSYIIPGGLGGFGLELADWLVLRGCRKLVLSSSRGISKQYQAYRINIWKAYGVDVKVDTSDITTKTGCEKLIRDSMKLGPVGGIFNLAVLLKDSIFDNQDAETFVKCMAPKAVATKHLDELSRVLCPELQYFVVFSSVSCGRGNAGQSNYGMANSVMEKIIEQRHNLRLPAKSIQWGAVGEVGLVADMLEDKLDMEIGGTLQQRISSCLEELDALMNVKQPLVSSMVVAEKRYKSDVKGKILEAIMKIMSIRDIKSVSMESTLSELGMDSLMTVEIQQTLERTYDLVLAAHELRAISIAQLVKYANRDEPDQQVKSQKHIAPPSGMLLSLLRNFDDDAKFHQIILELQSDSKGGTKTLIVPGIEGMTNEAWQHIAQNLNGPTYILQGGKTWEALDIESIYAVVFPEVKKIFEHHEKFIIIGYSFGSILTIKLAKGLEDMGKTGKVIALDGSPKFIQRLTKDHVGNGTDETIQTIALLHIVTMTFPDDNEDIKKQILSERTWDKRLSMLLNIYKVHLYSEDNGYKIVNALVNRMKLALALNLDSIPSLDQTPLFLIRPSEISLIDIEEDYGLSAYSSKRIEIKFIEGNHQSVLENPALIDFINKHLA